MKDIALTRARLTRYLTFDSALDSCQAVLGTNGRACSPAHELEVFMPDAAECPPLSADCCDPTPLVPLCGAVSVKVTSKLLGVPKPVCDLSAGAGMGCANARTKQMAQPCISPWPSQS